MFQLPSLLDKFNSEIKEKISRFGIHKKIPKGAEILHEGQIITVVPLVLDGLLKVITRHDDKEFLLYYIQPSESCIMSFFGVIHHQKSKVYALTETDTEVLLLPADLVHDLIKHYPEFSLFFHQLQNVRYFDLLQTLHEVLFENLDTRILNYLREKAEQTKDPFIKIRHREIADAMGTSREVISRVTKKLEFEKMIAQYPDGIEVRL